MAKSRRLVFVSLLAPLAGCGASLAGDGGTPATDAAMMMIADGPGSPAHDAAIAPPDLGRQPTADELAAFDQLVAFARDDLTQSGAPGASIAVVLHDELIMAAGVGLRVSGGAPVTTATRFRVASLSKMITAAAAMSVVDQGKLDVHAPITNYIPWFKLANGFDAGQITLHQVLTHTSGFPCDVFPICAGAGLADKQTWFAANPQPLWAPPGTAFDYSNYGYALASLVALGAAGVDESAFDQFVADRVFGPTGMSTATYDTALVEAGDYAMGHVVDATGKVIAMEDPKLNDCPLSHPFGGVMATATDYAHFAIALNSGGGGALTPGSVKAMESPFAPSGYFPGQSYGYAIMSQVTPFGAADPFLWHNGELKGFQTEIWMVPGEQFAAVVLINASGGAQAHPINPEWVLGRALTLFVNKAQTQVTPEPSNPAIWQKLAGVYNDPYGQLGVMTVTFSQPNGGAASLTVNSSRNVIHGAMRAGLENADWTLPDGTEAHFYQSAGGVYDRLVTRLGVANRQ